MKLNKILMTTCMLWVGHTVNAEQMADAPKPPQPAVTHINHDHGIATQANTKAPTSKRNTHHARQKSPIKTNPLLKAKASTAVSAAVACNVNAFATSSSTTLISELTSQGPTCINELFSAVANIQVAAFSSDNMYAVANHVKGLSTSYAGGGDVNIEGLFLYLRAGYYVEFYNDGVTFISWVKPAVKNAIDAFVNNANFYQDNDGHGKTLSEVLIAMDSSEQQDVYLPVVKQWLNRWDQSMAAKWNLRSAVNGIFTILFRGQYNNNFKTLVGTDTTLVARLQDFVMSSWMVDSDAEYLIANAARELGRLKMYSGTAIQANVDTALNAIFNSSYVSYGYGDAVWLGAADTAGYYGNCADYGICNYKAQLEANALSQLHVCSPTIKIRSQNLTALQQSSACSTMAAEETYFHNKLETGNVAIPGDNNAQLQVNIFDSSDDYGKYAGHIFGINTNNGGMYLEGDPSVAGNVPNFIAYEASYAKADHFVWNLEHEYVHYLDGRFDLFGDFNSPTEPVVWWAEGVAEYVANQNDNQAAIDTINDGSTYTLDTIFNTTYDGFDQDRIYRWGYLAVRFMFERHFTEVKAMIAETRAGNWTAYKTRVTNWASNYGTEFTTWTQGLTNNPGNIAPIVSINGPYNAGINSNISFSSAGSSDPDGSIASYAWDFGDGTTSDKASPNHSYTTANNYTVNLSITDNLGLISSASTTATITGIEPPSGTLVNGVSKAITGIQDSESNFILEVPVGASDLSFSINGGSGDADLYVNFGSAATQSNYQCRPYQGGNNEVCDISNIQAGTYHVMIRGYNAYEANLIASFTESSGSSNVPDVCASQGTQSSGQLQNGSAICLANADPLWFSIGEVSGHNSIAISTGNGSGDLSIEFSNFGWPNGSNLHGWSANEGNNECIYLTNLSEYWGYIKVSGNAEGAALVVDFDTAGCR